jgi:hypothetical protein
MRVLFIRCWSRVVYDATCKALRAKVQSITMRFFLHATTGLSLCQGALAAFGLTSTSSTFKVDTDAGLVFEVKKYVASAGEGDIVTNPLVEPMATYLAFYTMVLNTKAPPKLRR